MKTPRQSRQDRRRRREIAEAVRSEFELEPRSRFRSLGRLATSVAAFDRERVRSHARTAAPASAPTPQSPAPIRSTARPTVERPVPPRSP